MPRSLWTGAIAFGLVTIPVKLYSATEPRAEISFRLLHKKDQAPVDYRRFCRAENVEVEWRDIVRGYEYDTGRFVVLTDEDFEKAKTPGTQTLEIRDFVPAAQIDVAYFESPYWLEPARAGGKAYQLLREALQRSGRVGIGTFVMRQREHLAALRPADHALMLTTMRFAGEIASPDKLDLPRAARLDPRELKLALDLVETLAGDFKPEKYRDTYRETLRAAIERKLEGKEVEAPERPPAPKVVDLMEALRASLKQPRRERAEPAPRHRRKAGARRRAA
jgi:DNA end-binding protein Ku